MLVVVKRYHERVDSHGALLGDTVEDRHENCKEPSNSMDDEEERDIPEEEVGHADQNALMVVVDALAL